MFVVHALPVAKFQQRPLRKLTPNRTALHDSTLDKESFRGNYQYEQPDTSLQGMNPSTLEIITNGSNEVQFSPKGEYDV